jgi:hypothetical protein
MSKVPTPVAHITTGGSIFFSLFRIAHDYALLKQATLNREIEQRRLNEIRLTELRKVG